MKARSDLPTHEGFVGPVTWIIRQSPKPLIVDITRGPKTMTLTYTLSEKPPVEPPRRRVPSHRRLLEGRHARHRNGAEHPRADGDDQRNATLQPDGREITSSGSCRSSTVTPCRGAQNYNTVKDMFTKGTH